MLVADASRQSFAVEPDKLVAFCFGVSPLAHQIGQSCVPRLFLAGSCLRILNDDELQGVGEVGSRRSCAPKLAPNIRNSAWNYGSEETRGSSPRVKEGSAYPVPPSTGHTDSCGAQGTSRSFGARDGISGRYPRFLRGRPRKEGSRLLGARGATRLSPWGRGPCGSRQRCPPLKAVLIPGPGWLWA